jgi:hypothetical protein
MEPLVKLELFMVGQKVTILADRDGTLTGRVVGITIESNQSVYYRVAFFDPEYRVDTFADFMVVAYVDEDNHGQKALSIGFHK